MPYFQTVPADPRETNLWDALLGLGSGYMQGAEKSRKGNFEKELLATLLNKGDIGSVINRQPPQGILEGIGDALSPKGTYQGGMSGLSPITQNILTDVLQRRMNPNIGREEDMRFANLEMRNELLGKQVEQFGQPEPPDPADAEKRIKLYSDQLVKLNKDFLDRKTDINKRAALINRWPEDVRAYFGPELLYNPPQRQPEKEKDEFGDAPWWLAPEHKDTPQGRAAREKAERIPEKTGKTIQMRYYEPRNGKWVMRAQRVSAKDWNIKEAEIIAAGGRLEKPEKPDKDAARKGLSFTDVEKLREAIIGRLGEVSDWFDPDWPADKLLSLYTKAAGQLGYPAMTPDQQDQFDMIWDDIVGQDPSEYQWDPASPEVWRVRETLRGGNKMTAPAGQPLYQGGMGQTPAGQDIRMYSAPDMEPNSPPITVRPDFYDDLTAAQKAIDAGKDPTAVKNRLLQNYTDPNDIDVIKKVIGGR